MFRQKKVKPKKLKGNYLSNYFVIALVIIIALSGIAIAVKTKDNQKQNVILVTDDDLINIPTPSRSVAKGEQLENIPLTTVKWPKSRLTAEYLSSSENYKNWTTITPLPKLLPIPFSALSNISNDKNQVTEGIPQGMRAITVRVDIESAVEGWAQSGNFVDVILVRQSKNSENGLESKVIAENIKILSAGSSAQAQTTESTAPKAPATVTLLTSQEEALKIKTAVSIGKLTFALRGNGDNLKTASLEMNQKMLLGTINKITSIEKKDYNGMAKGPDGKVYLLEGSSKWIQSSNSPKSITIRD